VRLPLYADSLTLAGTNLQTLLDGKVDSTPAGIAAAGGMTNNAFTINGVVVGAGSNVTVAAAGGASSFQDLTNAPTKAIQFPTNAPSGGTLLLASQDGGTNWRYVATETLTWTNAPIGASFGITNAVTVPASAVELIVPWASVSDNRGATNGLQAGGKYKPTRNGQWMFSAHVELQGSTKDKRYAMWMKYSTSSAGATNFVCRDLEYSSLLAAEVSLAITKTMTCDTNYLVWFSVESTATSPTTLEPAFNITFMDVQYLGPSP
jgi:hypothetical protein